MPEATLQRRIYTMSIISQNNENEVAILNCVQRFFSSHKVGSLLRKCNGTKEKGSPAISLLRYKLSIVFTGRSMYMQQKTGSFIERFLIVFCDNRIVAKPIYSPCGFIKPFFIKDLSRILRKDFNNIKLFFQQRDFFPN